MSENAFPQPTTKYGCLIKVKRARAVQQIMELVGECRLVHRFLSGKSERSFWLLFKFVDAVLRGFSQVVFANNTLSGLLVVIGLGVADLEMCAAGILAASVAAATALIFNQSWDAISNGLMTYNGVLVGTVTASLSPPIVEATKGPTYLVWLLIAFGGALSTLVTSAMSNLCKGVSLPPMTVPFNLIDFLLFVCLPSAMTHLSVKQPDAGPSFDILHAANNSTVLDPSVDWKMVLRGSFVSMGQVYAAESVLCSVIMYLGILLYSPILTVALFSGSLLASICALGLTNDYGSIYSGLWGYNSALTAGAISATFNVPTVLSILTASLAIVFTAACQRAFSLVLTGAGLPVLTIPFVVTSAMFLAVSSGSGRESLVKAPDGRPPELQRKRFARQRSSHSSCV